MNIPPAALENWLASDASKSAGDSGDAHSTGRASGRRIVTIKRTREDYLLAEPWDHIAKFVGYIKRHCAQGDPKEGVETSKWRYLLMNWGHDPLRADDGSYGGLEEKNTPQPSRGASYHSSCEPV